MCTCEEIASPMKEFDRKPAENIARSALKFKRYIIVARLNLNFFIYTFTRIEYRIHWCKKNLLIFLFFYLLNSLGFQATLGGKKTGATGGTLYWSPPEKENPGKGSDSRVILRGLRSFH